MMYCTASIGSRLKQWMVPEVVRSVMGGSMIPVLGASPASQSHGGWGFQVLISFSNLLYLGQKSFDGEPN